MPLPLLTRMVEGAASDDGHQGTSVRSVAASDAGGPRPTRPFLSPPGAVTRAELRARFGARGLCRHWATLRRPGRLLQVTANPLLRGPALRAPTDAGGGRPVQSPLVPRLRPDGVPARSLQPDAHSGALRISGLPSVLREDRGAVHRCQVGLGAGTLHRRD